MRSVSRNGPGTSGCSRGWSPTTATGSKGSRRAWTSAARNSRRKRQPTGSSPEAVEQGVQGVAQHVARRRRVLAGAFDARVDGEHGDTVHLGPDGERIGLHHAGTQEAGGLHTLQHVGERLETAFARRLEFRVFMLV